MLDLRSMSRLCPQNALEADDFASALGHSTQASGACLLTGDRSSHSLRAVTGLRRGFANPDVNHPPKCPPTLHFANRDAR